MEMSGQFVANEDDKPDVMVRIDPMGQVTEIQSVTRLPNYERLPHHSTIDRIP
jgi:hypothetical protein